MAAEYEVNIKINSKKVTRQLGDIDKAISKINKTASNVGKPKGGSSRRKPGIAGLLPSSEELKAAEKGLVQLTAKTKNLQNIAAKAKDLQSVQAKFSERRLRALNRSNTLNEKELRLSQRLTSEARTRLRLLSQSGAKGFDATRPQGRQMAESINALTNVQDKRARLLNKINEMETKGLNVQKLRKQLGKATTEQSARRFGSAEKEFRILEKTLRLEQSKLRILKEQQKGFAASPVRGTPTMMGSPAQIAAAARAGGATSPIRGGLDFPGSPAFLAGATASRTPFGPSFPSGGAALPIRGSTAIPGSPKAIQAAKATELRATQVQGSWSKALGQLQETAKIFKSKNAQVKQSWTIALSQLEATAKDISTNRAARVKQSWATALGQLEETAKDISKNRAIERRKRGRQRLEQVGLGAGFPLLFGGGAGSVIGGGLGGLTGSFGAQIAFSAIGQQIDTFVAGMVDAGKAFTSVGSAAAFMTEKSLFSSDAMQFRIEKLIEEGNVTEAAALMTQEMAKKVGGSGLKALKDLGTEASKMGKLFGTVMLRIQAFMAKALTPLINLINSAIGGMLAQNQLDQMLAEAGSPERRAAILARSNELRGTTKQGKASIGRKPVTMKIIETLQSEFAPVIPEGAAIEPTRLEVLRAADKTDTEAKKAARLAERQELEAFLALNKQMTAELDRQDEINEMNGKYLAEQLNTADQINDSQEKRAGLLNAQINGTEEEFRLNQAIEEIKKKGLLPADEQRLIRAEKQIFALQRQNEQVEKQKQLYEQIGQTIKSGLVDGIMSALDGTKSLSEALSGVLRQLASVFLNVGVSQFGQALKIPGFANGGRPPVGRPSIVGERGPELFVPNRSGTIIPNHAMGGANVTVNVDASGSNVQGDGRQGKALGQAIGAAVQAELIKQKRPGGLLS